MKGSKATVGGPVVYNRSMDPETTAKETSTDWESQVLARFRGGEVEAFEEIVLCYQDRLYNTIYRMSWNEDETRDVLQDTFLKAFRSLGDFRGESSIGTWLYRIGINTFLQRRSKDRPESIEDLPLEEFQLSFREGLRVRPPTPEEALEEKQGRTLLENAIAKLPEEYRQVLVLRDVEGRSANETSELLGISVPAVKSRLHRARLFVRRELEKRTSS
ncbi:MAG: RNA polymerase sigma factor [Nitrospinota bacterium]